MKTGDTTRKLEGDRELTRTPLLALQALGQSIWLDFIRRGMFSSGDLQQLIDAAVAAAVDARVR